MASPASMCAKVEAESPADAAGLRTDDTIHGVEENHWSRGI